MNPTKCTVVVLSCDKYSDLWDPFFKLFSIQWPNCNFPIVLVSERKEYVCPYVKVKTFQFDGRVDAPWSRRIKQCLKSLDSEYVIILMDDFFLEKEVQIEKLNQCFSWMDENKDIACFSFVPSLWEDIETGEFPGFEERPVGGLYRVNCQAGLWRRKNLIKLMTPYEDPWDFEEQASNRSNKTQLRFFASRKGKPWVFEYDFICGGGVHRGKWTKGVKQLFDHYNIQIDYSERGWDESPEIPWADIPYTNPPSKTFYASIRERLAYIYHHFPNIIKGYF